MRRVRLIFYALFLITTLGVSGCNNEAVTIPSTNATYNPNDEAMLSTPTMKVRVTRSVIGGGEAFFHGTTDLYDATLQTQLYQDEEPLDWWPADQDVKANGYVWEITVTLEKELPAESSYYLKIWNKDNPSLYGTYHFDLEGPPAIP